MRPAIPMYCIVRQYAHARGLPFFTTTQQDIAFNLYYEHASINN